jgi:hypothetical protein
VGFRTGLLIGVLATAVVALGVAVVILAGGKSDNSGTTVATTAQAEVGPPCQLESMGGEVEIELSSEDLSCADARGVYTQYKELVRSGQAAGIGKASEVAGWSCEEFPLAEYPLIVRCRQGAAKFAVVGLAPDAHVNQKQIPASGRSEPATFQTPSGNIGCRLSTASVRCDIFKRDWSPPPKPADCEFPGWGHSIELDSSGSAFLCSDDAVIDPNGGSGVPVLQYGKAVEVGPFACESREQALICIAKSSRGFRLSVQEVNLF